MYNYKILEKIPGFKIEQGHLKKLSKSGNNFIIISNFCPILKRKIRLNNSKKIKIIMCFDGEAQTSDFTIFSDNLEKISDFYPFEGVIFPNTRGFDKDIIFIIKKMLACIPEESVYEIYETGWKELSECHAYFHGGGFFSSVDFANKDINIDISDSIKDKVIRFDKNSSPEESLYYVLALYNFHPPISNMLVANLIVGVTRTLFENAGLIPSYIMYIYGRQGFCKTTIADLCSNIYQEAEPIIGLNSSLSAIEAKLSEYKDSVFLIDDLCRSEFKSNEKRLGENFSQIVMEIANNKLRSVKKGNSVTDNECNCTVVTTGEYLVGSESAMTRCILLENKNAPNKAVLTKLQHNKQNLYNFLGHFLSWVSENYDEIVNDIKERHNKYRLSRAEVNFDNERLQNNLFIIDTGFNLLLDYALQNNLISENFYFHLIENFNSIRKTVFTSQIIAMKSHSGFKIKNYDFYDAVKDLYLKGAFILKNKPKAPFDGFDGTMKNGFLCLKKENLLQKIQIYFNDRKISKLDITRQLDSIGVLEKDKSNASTKKIDKERFLIIRLL